MIDHSSASRFSTGVPVSATRCAAPQPPRRLGGPRQAVLDRLRLVEHHPAASRIRPSSSMSRVRGGVGGDDQVGVAASRSRSASPRSRSPAVVGVDPQPGSELRRLPLPVADQRHRAQQQRRPGIRARAARCADSSASSCTVLPSPMSSARQRPEAQRGQERQPGQPALLVGPQGGGERRPAGRPASAIWPRCRPAVRPASRRRCTRGHRQRGVQIVRVAGGQRQHLGGGPGPAGSRRGTPGHAAAARGRRRPTARAAGSAAPWSRPARRSRRRSACRRRPPAATGSPPADSRPNVAAGHHPVDRGARGLALRPSLRRRSHHDGSSTPKPASSSAGATTARNR